MSAAVGRENRAAPEAMAVHFKNYDLQDDDDIFSLGYVNSLFAMQLVMFVESEFSITAQQEDLDINNFCSIAALTDFVHRKLGQVDPESGCERPAY